MTMPLGNAAAHDAFFMAAGNGLHHAWLFAGPRGIGKASFAAIAAERLLAHAADPSVSIRSDAGGAGGRTASLMAAGSHPDHRLLRRLPKDSEKPDQDLARSISIDQVRSLQTMFATRPALSSRRVVVIDAIDDLERPAANALLKNLEEPPEGTVFLLISHAPGRLLPTIRSRCRMLRFEALDDATVASAIRMAQPDTPDAELAAMVNLAAGAPGAALERSGLGLDSIERDLIAIAGDGDPTNARRVRLAKSLSGKAGQGKYAAFLDYAPAFVARAARVRTGADLRAALDAYSDARSLSAFAMAVTLDAQATAFEMAGIVARLAPGGGAR